MRAKRTAVPNNIQDTNRHHQHHNQYRQHRPSSATTIAAMTPISPPERVSDTARSGIDQEEDDADDVLKPIVPFDTASFNDRLVNKNQDVVNYFNNVITELYGLCDGVRNFLSLYITTKQNELLENVERGILDIQEAEESQERTRTSMVNFLQTVGKAFQTLQELEASGLMK
ncbi:hypothetical protein SeMB42_g06362 [Synchytrium endobioticum]|uniref:Uncharacterized protein n=1 Tax=Synchytrium endobioticum TaxID=286115 RepID=A0A507CIM6_9FUNG|nr:hypothetical protein SeMB42_g06362 [Synchytrium endobioticum]TPX42406.1 hypothetical protein SeLEV6574_g05622 [Synchytrium endobioticum]